MKKLWYEHFWAAVGGRKNLNSYIGSALIYTYAYLSNAPFREFAVYIVILLGFGQAINMLQKRLVQLPDQELPDAPPESDK